MNLERDRNHTNRSAFRDTGIILVGLFVVAAAALAQSGSEGIENGYKYQGSIELGYRFVNSLGAQSVYDTFVNQHQGPRVLDETLSARSTTRGRYSTIFSFRASDGAEIRKMPRGCACRRTAGTTSTCLSGGTRISSITTRWPTR